MTISNINILIVDDEEEITNMLKNYFAFESYNIMTCNSSLKAFEIIQNQNIHILITDILMPELTGIELIEKSKNYNGLIQVVVITGYVTFDNIVTAFKLGAQNCFFKPFKNLEELKVEIVNIIQKINRIQSIITNLRKIK